MEQRITRQETLVPFRLDLPALKALTTRVCQQFPESSIVHIRLKIEDRSITATDVNELGNAPDLPDTIREFWVSIDAPYDDKDPKSFFLNSPDSSLVSPSIRAESASAAWCAGVIDVAKSFLENHVPWYGGFRTFPLIGIVILIPIGFAFATTTGALTPHWRLAAFLTWLAFAVLLLFRSELLPAGVLLIRTKASHWNERIPAIGLLIAVLSLVATIAQVVVGLMAVPAIPQTPQERPKAPHPAESTPQPPKARP